MKILLAMLIMGFVGLSYAIDVTNCSVITSPGIYDLTNDITGKPNTVFSANPACIIINSDDVYFDCHGYSITNDPAPSGFSYGVITTFVNNVTIIDCNINSYSSNLVMYYTNDSLAANVNSLDSTSVSLQCYACNFVEFEQNFADSASGYGIQVYASNGVLIDSNTIMSQFIVSSSNGTVVQNNFVDSFYSVFEDHDSISQNNEFGSSTIVDLDPASDLFVERDYYNVPGSNYAAFGLVSSGEPFRVNGVSHPPLSIAGLEFVEGKTLDISLDDDLDEFYMFYLDSELAGHDENNFHLVIYDGSWEYPTNQYNDFVNNIIGTNNLPQSTDYVAIVERIDFSAPAITITNQNYTNNNTITFNAADNYDSILNCQIFVDSLSVQNLSVNNDTDTDVALPLTNGYHVFDVQCRDDMGNSNIQSSNITYDTIGPTVSFESIGYTNNNHVNVTITDSYDNVIDCEFFIDLISVQNGSFVNGSLSSIIIPFNYGSQVLEAVCEDDLGNTGSNSEPLIFDDVPPIVTLIGPASGVTTEISPYGFRFIAVEDYPRINCSLIVNGNVTATNNSIINNLTTSMQSPIALGSNIWSVNCSDDLGNTAASSNWTINRVDRSSNSGGGSSGSSNKIDIKTSYNCSHMVISITENGNPIDGLVDFGVGSGWTVDGKLTIPIVCEQDYTITYLSEIEQVKVDCSNCKKCSNSENLVDGKCISKCVANEYWNGASCVKTEVKCKDSEIFDGTNCIEVECKNDDQCSSTQYCSGNSCLDLGCGLVQDHKIVEIYECDQGNSACSVCSSGSLCVDHKCVEPILSTSNECKVGKDCVNRADMGDESGYVEIVDQSGKIISSGVPSSGIFKFVPEISGPYKIILYDQKGGNTILSSNFNVLGEDKIVVEEPKPTVQKDDGTIIAYAALLLLIIGGVVLFFRMKKR